MRNGAWIRRSRADRADRVDGVDARAALFSRMRRVRRAGTTQRGEGMCGMCGKVPRCDGSAVRTHSGTRVEDRQVLQGADWCVGVRSAHRGRGRTW
eukprot:scaffold91844_cov48-Phaeocystis_antarctica.AAC.1